MSRATRLPNNRAALGDGEYMALSPAQQRAIEQSDQAMQNLSFTEFDQALAAGQLQRALGSVGGLSNLLNAGPQLRRNLSSARASLERAQADGIAAIGGSADERRANVQAVQRAQAQLSEMQRLYAQHGARLAAVRQAQLASRAADRNQQQALQQAQQANQASRQALRDPWHIRLLRSLAGRGPSREFEAEAELEAMLWDRKGTRGQAGHFPVRHLEAKLRQQGFLVKHHFLQRLLQRAQAEGIRFDPATFRREFLGARHYRQTGGAHNSRVAVMRGLPILYTLGGNNANRIVLIGMLPQGAVPQGEPVSAPAMR